MWAFLLQAEITAAFEQAMEPGRHHGSLAQQVIGLESASAHASQLLLQDPDLGLSDLLLLLEALITHCCLFSFLLM